MFRWLRALVLALASLCERRQYRRGRAWLRRHSIASTATATTRRWPTRALRSLAGKPRRRRSCLAGRLAWPAPPPPLSFRRAIANASACSALGTPSNRLKPPASPAPTPWADSARLPVNPRLAGWRSSPIDTLCDRFRTVCPRVWRGRHRGAFSRPQIRRATIGRVFGSARDATKKPHPLLSQPHGFAGHLACAQGTQWGWITFRSMRVHRAPSRVTPERFSVPACVPNPFNVCS